MDRKKCAVALRESAGFVILAVLLLVGLLSSWFMCRNHDALSRQMEDAAWSALSGQRHQARDTADSARAQWQQRRNIRAAFADHTPMEEIDSLFAQLSVYAASEDWVQFAAICESLARHIQAMGDAHRLTWWNLL